MITITSNSNNLVITNTDKFGYPFQDGQLTLPINSLVYTLENNSDYITFRSAANNDVLFAGNIGNITIDGTVVTRDNFVDTFNGIAYASVGSGSGSGSSITVDDALSTASTNPVQNKVISEKINEVITDVDTLERTNINGVSLSGQTITLQQDPIYTDYTVSQPSATGNNIYMRDVMSDRNYTHTFGFDKTYTSLVDGYFIGDLTVGETTEMCPSWDGTSITFEADSANSIGNLETYLVYTDNDTNAEVEAGVTMQFGTGMEGDRIVFLLNGGNNKATEFYTSGGIGMVTINGSYLNYMQPLLENGSMYWYDLTGISTPYTITITMLSEASKTTFETEKNVTVGSAWLSVGYNTAIAGKAEGAVNTDTAPERLSDYIRYANSQKAYILTDKNFSNVTYTKEEIDNKVENAGGGSDITVQSSTTGTSANYIYSSGVWGDGKTVISYIYPHTSINSEDVLTVDFACATWGMTDISQANTNPYRLPNATTTTAGIMTATDKTKLDSLNVVNEWVGTQAEYDALTTYDADTTYYIVEE